MAPTTVYENTPTVVSTGKQSASALVLSTILFDDAAGHCSAYFSNQGYSKLAGLMAGKNEKNETVLGADFCYHVNEDIAGPPPTTTGWYQSKGLPSQQDPTPYGECRPFISRSGGTRPLGLTWFHDAILVSTTCL